MKKKLLFLATILPLFLSAAEICIWQFDPEDVYYESEVGRTVVSSYGLQTTLTAMGHHCTVYNALPLNLTGFDLVFVSTGWYRC